MSQSSKGRWLSTSAEGRATTTEVVRLLAQSRVLPREAQERLNIKILVANRSRILQEALALAIAEWDDALVAIENPQDAAILKATEAFRPHVLIVSLERPNTVSSLCLPLFQRFPELTILGVGCGCNDLVALTFSGAMHMIRLRDSLRSLRNFLREKQRSLAAAGTTGQNVCQRRGHARGHEDHK